MDSPQLQGWVPRSSSTTSEPTITIRLKPAVLGYHEVFHLLVIAGVAAHFLAISLFVLPTG